MIIKADSTANYIYYIIIFMPAWQVLTFVNWIYFQFINLNISIYFPHSFHKNKLPHSSRNYEVYSCKCRLLFKHAPLHEQTQRHTHTFAHSIKPVQQLTLRIRNVDSLQTDIVHLKQLKSLSQPWRRLISSCDYVATRSVQAFPHSPLPTLRAIEGPSIKI